MFPVKWNKLQLTVEINSLYENVLLLGADDGARERARGFLTPVELRNSRVEAMKHQESPWFASSIRKSFAMRRKKIVARLKKESRWKRNIILHHKHPVLIVQTPTRRYFMQSAREAFSSERNFLHRENSSWQACSGKRGKCWRDGNENRVRKENSVVEVSTKKETRKQHQSQPSLPINFAPRIVYLSIESFQFPQNI